jgi:SAM-dependent methyltransferase
MSDIPETWHYGLVARWWAECNRPEPEELAFYRSWVERDGQPALDLGCGNGRLLLPLVRAGLEVDGCDISPDMLARCRDQADKEGLTVRLYQQAFHELDLPVAYRTIYICDSFGLGGNRSHDAEALRRCHRHLAPGGALVFSHYLPYDDPEQWPAWLPEGRGRLPEPWSETGRRSPASDGDELELRARLVDLDPIDQRATRQIRVTLWRDGIAVDEEEHQLQESMYFYNEVLLMLEAAGFGDVTVRAGYADRPATADEAMVVYVARK